MRKPKRQGSQRSAERRVGLARALSKLGYCSRSEAAERIRAGEVTLNGSITRNPEAPVRLGSDRIAVGGEPVGAKAKVYWMMNKPRGVATTAGDEKGRQTVYDLLFEGAGSEGLPWIAPVGRLDKASEGLLLFTNDSEWAARVTSPDSHMDKTYHVQIDAVGDDSLLRSLEAGICAKDGERLRAKRATLLRAGQKNSWLVIALDEGKNRQIRRMLEALKLEVLQLVRVAIGPLALGDLPKGTARPLTAQEKAALDQAIRAASSEPTSPATRESSSEWDR